MLFTEKQKIMYLFFLLTNHLCPSIPITYSLFHVDILRVLQYANPYIKTVPRELVQHPA